jgi:Maltokinase N-terminal cap domain
MAIIHSTATLSPTKLELLASWLPVQPWYLDQGREPELARAGGFRLDDPRGEVGIEFMVVTDGSGAGVASYLVPMTYRASALASANGALIGTAEHGVLGRRWIYDGARDPVLVAQLVALIQGDAEPQAQSVSDTPDPTVISEPVTSGSLTAVDSAVAASEPSGTVLRVETAGAGGVRGGQLVVRVSRVLQPDGTAASASTAASGAPAASAGPAASVAEAGRPCLTATWRLPDGTRVRGVMASARYI